MRRSVWLWLTAALAGSCAAGCHGTSGHTGPSDPLFVNKKPIEATAEFKAPHTVVCVEPSLPPVPPLVLAATHRHQPAPAPETTVSTDAPAEASEPHDR
jgi:hypothetical protein